MAAEAGVVRTTLARLGTVRVRTTLAALAVVGVASALGAVVLVASLRSALVDDIEASAERRAGEVIAALQAGASPSLGGADDDDELVQVLGPDGTVSASSPNVRGRGPIVALGDGRRTLEVEVDGERERFLVIVERLDATTDDDADDADDADETQGGARQGGDDVGAGTAPDGGAAPDATPSAAGGPEAAAVVVGRSLDEVGDSTGALTGRLEVGAPLLVALVGITTWAVVGRALRPVDQIRREVDEITVAGLHRRVPVPASRDEVAHLADTMNRMLARLEAGQARQRQFVSDASHELRSPVASLRQHAEVARLHRDRVDLDRLADVVLAESARMQELIEDLLLLARADEGSLRPVLRPVDVDDLVFDEARRLRGRRDLRIDTSQVGAGRVLGSEAGLRRAVRNLGENALRHATGVVAFTLTTQEGAVVLHVDDDGPGIPAPDRARVLERFVRLDEGRARDAGGAGLGLAIVREVVDVHSGTVTIADGPSGGARLTIHLPAAPENGGSVGDDVVGALPPQPVVGTIDRKRGREST